MKSAKRLFRYIVLQKTIKYRIVNGNVKSTVTCSEIVGIVGRRNSWNPYNTQMERIRRQRDANLLFGC